MIYATVEELIAAVPDPSLLAQATGTEEPDDAKLEKALDDASAKIDGYIGSRYSLPLPEVPPVLRTYCIDIALYGLLNFRALGDLEDVRLRYKDAIDFLKDLIKGGVSLGLPETATAPPASGTAFIGGSSIMKGLDY